MATETNNMNLDISENAAKQISHLLQQEPENTFLRISVDGGGCNGFQYKFDFDRERSEEDKIFSRNGAEIVIDEMSLEFVGGSIVDYIETLGAAHFEIKNPNAASSCGCGNSFSV